MKNNSISAEIARKTLTQLAKNSLPPTPENYANAYNQIAGNNSPSVNRSLQKVLLKAAVKNPQLADVEKSFSAAVKKQDWVSVESQLEKIFANTVHSKQPNHPN